MGYIFIDKGDDDGMEKVRHNMRKNMRSGRYSYPMMRHHDDDGYEHGYRKGYEHGWEDHEHEMDEEHEYRRRRDSRGRYM